MKRLTTLTRTFAITAAFLPALTHAVSVTTGVGSGADVQVTEYNSTPQDTLGNTSQLNARTGTTVNEIIALRFDLSGYTLSDLQGVTLSLTNFRTNSTGTLHLYAVNDGATGSDNNGTVAGFTDNTWSETSVKFSTMPGLTYDGTASQGINSGSVTDLGTLITTSANVAEGSLVTFSMAGLTTFLNNNPDSLVTFLLAVDTSSTGQRRFASDEATALDPINPAYAGPFPAGTFGPTLNFSVVPEPSVFALAGIGFGALAFVRRSRSS